jgi:hypothetical protein
MPRFHFHIKENGLLVEDEDGQDLEDHAAVRREAIATGASIARDAFIRGSAEQVTIVVQEGDAVVLRVSVSLVVEEWQTT